MRIWLGFSSRCSRISWCKNLHLFLGLAQLPNPLRVDSLPQAIHDKGSALSIPVGAGLVPALWAARRVAPTSQTGTEFSSRHQ